MFHSQPTAGREVKDEVRNIVKSEWEEGNEETQNYIKPCLFPVLSGTLHSPDIPSFAQRGPIWSLIICPVEAQIIQPSGFSA